jgi:hypothetical protein
MVTAEQLARLCVCGHKSIDHAGADGDGHCDGCHGSANECDEFRAVDELPSVAVRSIKLKPGQDGAVFMLELMEFLERRTDEYECEHKGLI